MNPESLDLWPRTLITRHLRGSQNYELFLKFLNFFLYNIRGKYLYSFHSQRRVYLVLLFLILKIVINICLFYIRENILIISVVTEFSPLHEMQTILKPSNPRI
jgi:hypothetical protein